MKKGIFRRIFALYALGILVAVITVEAYIASALRGNYIDDQKRNLLAQIGLISRDISFRNQHLDELCRQIKKETGARVTVIARDGRVAGDSDTDSSLMDNHLRRAEIEQALLFDSGVAIRHSDTLKHDFLYVARKVSDGEGIEGFVRLAVPLKEVDAAVNLLRVRILLVVVGVMLATWAFSLWQTEHLRRLLRQITDFSKALSQGEIGTRLFLRNAGEFDEIARNITLMSVNLQTVMSRIEEEKNRLNVILKSVPDALLIIDAKGYITLSSSSAKDFFGDIPGGGALFFEVVRNYEFSDLVDKVRRDLSPGMTEFRMDAPEEKYLSVRVSPLFYREGELSGFVAVFHDITGLKRLEQARKDFVANVSHELKTPITAIRGFADTLLEGALDDRDNAVKFVRTIKSNSERINNLVDDLMTISKIELGVIRVEKKVVEIGGVLETVAEMFRERAERKGLSLTVSDMAGISEIRADRDRLIQIMTNLVDNAIKFTDTGSVTLGTGREDEKIFLFVEDTGIGVPASHLPRLGERFYRVDAGRSRKMGGTGLGLAIVKHLVKAHGWTMKIDSAPGSGTRFRIVL